jgi:hypothetical protein
MHIMFLLLCAYLCLTKADYCSPGKCTAMQESQAKTFNRMDMDTGASTFEVHQREDAFKSGLLTFGGEYAYYDTVREQEKRAQNNNPWKVGTPFGYN